jgi:hypothetical protein
MPSPFCVSKRQHLHPIAANIAVRAQCLLESNLKNDVSAGRRQQARSPSFQRNTNTRARGKRAVRQDVRWVEWVKTCGEGWGNTSNVIPRSRCKCQLAFFFFFSNPKQKVIIAIGAVQRGKKKRGSCGGEDATQSGGSKTALSLRPLTSVSFAIPSSLHQKKRTIPAPLEL